MIVLTLKITDCSTANIAVQRKKVLQSTFIRKKRSCIRETENVIALIMFGFVTKLILKLINVHMYY